MRTRFLRRAAVFLAAVIVLAAGLSTVLQWGARSLLRLQGAPAGWAGAGESVLAAVFAVLLVAAVAVGRAFRRIAGPVEDGASPCRESGLIIFRGRGPFRCTDLRGQ